MCVHIGSDSGRAPRHVAKLSTRAGRARRRHDQTAVSGIAGTRRENNVAHYRAVTCGVVFRILDCSAGFAGSAQGEERCRSVPCRPRSSRSDPDGLQSRGGFRRSDGRSSPGAGSHNDAAAAWRHAMHLIALRLPGIRARFRHFIFMIQDRRGCTRQPASAGETRGVALQRRS
jgi:hypothetical protein